MFALLTSLCPLCTRVSQMNSPMAQTLSQNQTLHGYVAYNWSFGHFCDFLPILGKIWLPWQRPLDSSNQKCLLWIGQPRKLPVICNHILVVFRRNAFICIYSNFCPKIGCHGNAPLSLVFGRITYEFTNRKTLSQNQTLYRCVAYHWSYGNFCDFCACFDQNLVAMATPLDPCNKKCLPVLVNHENPLL